MPFSDEYTKRIAQLVKEELENEKLRMNIEAKVRVALAHYRMMEAFEKDAGFLDKFKTFVTTVGIGALMSFGTPEAKATAKDVENQLKDLSSKTYEKFKNDKNVFMELRHEGPKEEGNEGLNRYKFKIKVGPYETEGVFATNVSHYSNTAEIGVQKNISWKVVDKELLEKMKKDNNSQYDDLKKDVQEVIDSMEASLSKGQHKMVDHDGYWITPDVKRKLTVKTNEWIAEHFNGDLKGNPAPSGMQFWDGDNVKYDVFQEAAVESLYKDLKEDKNMLKEFQIKLPSFADFKNDIYKMFGKDPKKFYDSILTQKMKDKIDKEIKYKEVYPNKKKV